MSELVTTAPHEGDIFFKYQEFGLDPYYALAKILDTYGGSRRGTFAVSGEEYSATLYYQDSGIGDLNHEDVAFDTIREYRIKVRARDDPAGQKDGNIHFSPRTPDMEDEDGDQIQTPDMVGIQARFEASNIPFEDYAEIVHQATVAVGLSERYFAPEHALGPERHDDPPATSNVNDLARYVRIEHDEAGCFLSADGALARLHHVGADDRSGYRKHVADDRKAPGYKHQVVLDSSRVDEVVSHHKFPKEVKIYLPKEPDAFDEDDDLYHYKLEVALQSSKMSGSPSLDDLDRVSRECEELILNLLSWEGFPIEADEFDSPEPDDDGNLGPYQGDAYFEPGSEYRNRRIVSDPTPEMKERQENVVIRHLTNGLADGDWAVLEKLATDGGEVAPKDVAEEQDVHIDTVYRALERIDDLVEHTYGEIRLQSHYVAERITAAVQAARDGVEDAVETAAEALGPDGIDVDRMADAWSQWADRHLSGFADPPDDDPELDLGEVEDRYHLAELVHDGAQAWQDAGLRLGRYLDATVRYYQPGVGHQSEPARLIDFPSGFG